MGKQGFKECHGKKDEDVEEGKCQEGKARNKDKLRVGTWNTRGLGSKGQNTWQHSRWKCLKGVWEHRGWKAALVSDVKGEGKKVEEIGWGKWKWIIISRYRSSGSRRSMGGTVTERRMQNPTEQRWEEPSGRHSTEEVEGSASDGGLCTNIQNTLACERSNETGSGKATTRQW